MEKGNYRYPVKFNGIQDMLEFTHRASKCPGEVMLVNGHHRLSAKSFLSVMIAALSWDSVTVEADFDCYFEFEAFIAQ
ncbi:MAG: HPr family phosphocarrier protein [Clostridiales bacterium]|nr:HPr family phosphocarrier protein [Clostridiales bacterium]